jgi:hypothetical protein
LSADAKLGDEELAEASNDMPWLVLVGSGNPGMPWVRMHWAKLKSYWYSLSIP